MNISYTPPSGVQKMFPMYDPLHGRESDKELVIIDARFS